MKKILLSASMLFLALAAKAQDCTAVTTLDENFSNFTATTQNAFPQQCWNSIGANAQGPWIYVAATTGENANTYAVYYTHTAGANVAGYFVAPELSTIDGAHELSFDTFKLGQGGTIPAGNITVQVGTLTSATDASTFTAVGTAFTVTETSVTHANIVIPATTAQTFVAFKFIADSGFNAAALDNVVWSAVEVTEPVCEAVTFIDEDFTGFENFEDNCWEIIANGLPAGPAVYVDGDDENEFITFYASSSANTDAYLITPEVSTFDADHSLSFDAQRVALGPTVPGTVTIQVGTITDGSATFVPVTTGGTFTLTAATPATYTVAIPSAPAGSHIAFRISGDTPHNAASIDNVMWSTTAATQTFAKGAFTMFPNPTADKNVTLAFNANSGAEVVSVYSLTGAKVFEAAVTGNTTQNLNLSALSAGMYTVKVQAGNATTTQKLVIQ